MLCLYLCVSFDLYELNEGKAWYREGKHGREVNVDDIKVEPLRNEKGEIEKDANGEAKYRMTAVINGESISHEITQKQYEKFMAIDDYHRMKLFSHIFSEVDMKNIPDNKMAELTYDDFKKSSIFRMC